MYTLLRLFPLLIPPLIEAQELNISEALPKSHLDLPLDRSQAQALCSAIDSHPDACYLAKNVCLDPQDLVNFKRIYYCDLQKSLPLMLIASLLLLIVFFYILYYCSEYYLSIPLQRLVLAVEMDSQIAGVTLLSFANGAPDFFTALAGSDSGDGPPGSGLPLIIGSLLGSGMFTTCFAMAISLLVSHPKIDLPSRAELPFDSLELSDPPPSILEEQGSRSPRDKSWIVLPRGYFVNLGVYFSGFLLLVILCSTRSLNFAYPPIQFSLYLIYMVYTIYPRFQTRIQDILQDSWRPALFKTPTPPPLSSFEVPTVIITAPDMSHNNQAAGSDAFDVYSEPSPRPRRTSVANSNTLKLLITHDSNPLEREFDLGPSQSNRPEAPQQSILGIYRVYRYRGLSPCSDFRPSFDVEHSH